MGRTERKRRKSKKANILCDQSIINLQKWLSENHWKNHASLKIKPFVATGRGVTSKKSMSPNDILISIPLNLMITYRSIKINVPIKNKLNMHELLALFLIMEKNKGVESDWLQYIQSLPEEMPLLPWLADTEEFDLFPKDLRLLAGKTYDLYKEFRNKMADSDIEPKDDDNIYKWAYAMVNTRGVHVDPNLVSKWTFPELLSGKPSMALCPFLDMFNHHYLADTEAGLVQDGEELVYQLKTLTGFNKKKQIFISYGRHDNLKLMNEYGFFIPGNVHDTVVFELGVVQKLLGFNLDQQRYILIRYYNLHEELYIGYDGVSYNLKILLFFLCCNDFGSLHSTVFSDRYPERFLQVQLPRFIKKLLHFKSERFAKNLSILTDREISIFGKNVVEFVKYRLKFVEELKTILS